MQHENLAKLSTDPAWAGHYRTAHERAVNAGADDIDAEAYAAVAANIAAADAERAAADTQAAIDRANMAKAHPQLAGTDPPPAPKAAPVDHRAGWQRAAAAANSTLATGGGAVDTGERVNAGGSAAPSSESAKQIKSGWAKATEDANRRHGAGK